MFLESNKNYEVTIDTEGGSYDFTMNSESISALASALGNDENGCHIAKEDDGDLMIIPYRSIEIVRVDLDIIGDDEDEDQHDDEDSEVITVKQGGSYLLKVK